MRIAVYTLTRERLPYTEYCFGTLWNKAGQSFDHYVVDNGSQDLTPKWLKDNANRFERIIYLPENKGISEGSNTALKAIYESGKEYDLIIKFDNDCEIISDNILRQISEVFSSRCYQYILSPRVEGIDNQPKRAYYIQLGGRTIGVTSIVGGIFHVVPTVIYKKYAYPLSLPKAMGQDDVFCDWAKNAGIKIGYIEGLIVNHYESTSGQAVKFPEYFKRKRKEEAEVNHSDHVNTNTTKIVLDADDFYEGNDNLDLLKKFKKQNHKFKITLFTVIGKCSLSWISNIKNKYPWIDMVPHGLLHNDSYECLRWNLDEFRRYLDFVEYYDITKGFKAPGWQISDSMYQALLERNYWVADHPDNKDRIPKGMRFHITIPNWHFHIQNVCGNGLKESQERISLMDGNFMFIKDQLNIFNL